MVMPKLFAEDLISFPDPHLALEGIVDLSDDLSVERLLEAYSFGIFPWPHENYPTLWFCPAERGVLDFKDFKIPQSLKKFMRKTDFRVTMDKAFDRVIEACAKQPRPGQKGTWINAQILKAYKDFHRAGYAHSVEVWSGEELAGGIYGVYVGGLFCGESMFFKKSNASKYALVKLVEFLKEQKLTWMDVQMVTPLTEMFGGHYITRAQFLRRLEAAKKSAREINFEI
jgi:leucyl/phenylalanyl-tRNA--protein transferase